MPVIVGISPKSGVGLTQAQADYITSTGGTYIPVGSTQATTILTTTGQISQTVGSGAFTTFAEPAPYTAPAAAEIYVPGQATETTIYGTGDEIVTRNLGTVTEIYSPAESGQGYNVTDLSGNTITPTPVSTPKTSSSFLKLALIGLVGIALLKGRL
jgi:hypothetical protein